MRHNAAVHHSLIYVVDDILSTVYSLCLFLEYQEYRVVQFSSGQAMLEVVHEQVPDLIFLDVMMPEMDGFEVCKRLKADERTRDIPVIFITVKSAQEDKLKGFDAGGVDYITKPFDPKEVLARVKAHLTIRKQQRQVEQLNASRNKFFSIISHDLRNLLYVPLGSLELLLEHLRSFSLEEIEERLKTVHQSTEHLFDLLENLLIWASLQRGAMVYTPRSFPITSIIEELFFLVQAQADHKDITLVKNVQQEVRVYADPNMLRTILRNLISNALKFSRPGGQISFQAVPRGDMVEIHISDTGVGIPQEKLESLFLLDPQRPSKGTAGERGTGLGLLLCKELIEQHGGTLSVESEVNNGATFTFTLKHGEKYEPQH